MNRGGKVIALSVLGVVAIGTILSAVWVIWLGPLMSQRAAIRFFEAKWCLFLYDGQSKFLCRPFQQEPVMLFSGVPNDDDLVQLHSIPGLKYLLLSSTPVTGAGLPHVARVTQLEILELENLAMEDNDLIHLKILRNLHALSLSGTAIRGPGLLYLRELTKLKFLDLSFTKINNEAFGFLGDLGALEVLAVNSTALTDSCVVAIERLPWLREIDIEGTQITSTGQKTLETLRPTLKIWNLNPRLGIHIWNRRPLWEEVIPWSGLGPRIPQERKRFLGP